MVCHALRFLVPALVVLLAFSVPARAGTTTYVFKGDSGAGRTVDVQVVFTTSSGQLQIALSNFTTNANTVSVSEIITGLRFSVAGTTTASNLTDKVPLGTMLADVTSGPPNGSYTLTGPSSIVGSKKWHLDSTSGIYAISIMGNGQPDYGIIGPGNPTSPRFDYANGSIITNSHNPYAYKEGDFVLNIAGMTASSTFSNVQFQFNTVAGAGYKDGSPSEPIGGLSTPEPASMTLLVIGAIGMGGYGWRKWRKEKRFAP